MIEILLMFILFSSADNLIKNPSFEQINDKGIPTNWAFAEGPLEVSTTAHSGKNSVLVKPGSKRGLFRQSVLLEKGNRYDLCIHYKTVNLQLDFQYYVETSKVSYEGFYSSVSAKHLGTNGWTKECYTTGYVTCPNGENVTYSFGVLTKTGSNSSGEVYFDDISIERNVQFLRNVAISNDRDEVYDKLNVVYQSTIEQTKEDRDSWMFITKIVNEKGKEMTSVTTKKVEKNLETVTIYVDKLNLEVNKFYKVIGTLKNTHLNTSESGFYTFKKIDKVKRQYKIDEYGRVIYNNDLFFPLGIYLSSIKTTDFTMINKTHLNFVMPYGSASMEQMDYLYNTQGENVKIMYTIKDIYSFNKTTCESKDQDSCYTRALNTIKKYKDHPSLFAWYINDESEACFNKDLRNRTLTIHELDPNHPSVSVIWNTADSYDLMNTTDVLGLDIYPIPDTPIRRVHDKHVAIKDNTLGAKPLWNVVQLMDWDSYPTHDSKGNNRPPTEQELRHMSWQNIVNGATGLFYYSYYDLFKMENKSSVKDRWNELTEVTNEIWNYRYVILSVSSHERINYNESNKVSLKQWQYGGVDYIAVINLEREDMTFEMEFVYSKEREVIKDFGLGTMNVDNNKITLNLKPIDVMMIRIVNYNQSSSSACGVSIALFALLMFFIGLY